MDAPESAVHALYLMHGGRSCGGAGSGGGLFIPGEQPMLSSRNKELDAWMEKAGRKTKREGEIQWDEEGRGGRGR
jgi:hypothetical protein